MEYLFTFIEGLASFISPCVLPILPVYVSYFIGEHEKKNFKTVANALGFVLGFTFVFVTLAVFATQLGSLVKENIKYIKIVLGIIIIILGLNYMEVFKIKFLNKSYKMNSDKKNLNFLKSFSFGVLFSLGWTPCIGTFLSSALILAASSQSMVKGIVLMLIYSVGLGIPFIISAVFIDKLQSLFTFIKKNYTTVKKISGIILILMGIYTMFF